MPKHTGIPTPGQRFGRLIILAKADPYINKKGHKIGQSLCKCDCGSEKIIRNLNIKNGHTISCGCAAIQHGKCSTYMHTAWLAMRQRCLNPNHRSYKYYGGRGITVCPEWGSFSQFAYDLGERPSTSHSLDRTDNNRGYSPDNCRWATRKEQALNRRVTSLIEYNGRSMLLEDWARYLGISRTTLYYRVKKYGWSIEKAFSK